MILYILCEGQSEEAFINQVLKPYFQNTKPQLDFKPIITKTSPRYKGGGLKYHRIKKEILSLLNHKEAFVSTFFDYYALHNGFPQYNNQQGDIYQKIDSLEKAFCDDINGNLHPKRFFPHIQPHEFEALLFSDISKIIETDTLWQGNKTYLAKLQSITNQFPNPELINNSTQTSPSHRLEAIFPTYQKVFHSKNIAQKITITHIRTKCRHFNEWCEKISSL